MTKTPQVLIVDDDSIMRSMLEFAVKGYGYETVGEAEDGEAAVELYDLNRPDLVLLDVKLPKMDGVEALKRIRALDANAYVVMMTSVDDPDTIEACMIAGARDYLRKESPGGELADRLDRHLMRVKG